MDFTSGFEAIEKSKKTADIFEGELSQDTLSLMGEKIETAEKATNHKDKIPHSLRFLFIVIRLRFWNISQTLMEA